MRTEDLIDELANEVGPVRPLPPAWLRTVLWFAAAATFAAGVVLMMSPRPDLAEEARNVRF